MTIIYLMTMIHLTNTARKIKLGATHLMTASLNDISFYLNFDHKLRTTREGIIIKTVNVLLYIHILSNSAYTNQDLSTSSTTN